MYKTPLIVETPGGRGSADHLGRLEEQGRRDAEAQRLGGLEVDDELKRDELLDGEFSLLDREPLLERYGLGSPANHITAG